jgi:membrane-associated phospholipid phosphatase
MSWILLGSILSVALVIMLVVWGCRVMDRPQSLRIHITLGGIMVMLTGALFGFIANNVVSGGTLTVVDIEIAQWLHEHGSPLLTQCLFIITNLHDPWVISPVAALITLTLAWKKRWYAALAILLIVQGGMLLNLLAKQIFHRARPSFENPLITLTTYSFPSGHVVASTVFYGVLAALLITKTHSRSGAAVILLIASAMIVLVAFSRLYLGAHYLSDVLAAFLEAIAWLVLCLTAIHSYRIYYQQRSIFY